MGVNVLINGKKNITAEEIAEIGGLKYGILDDSYVLRQGEIGRYTLMYDSSCIGRGFQVAADGQDIELSLPLPNTPHDIEIFYDLIVRLCRKTEARVFMRDEELASVRECDRYIEADKLASVRALEDIASQIEEDKYNSFTIFAAMNPIEIGKEEIDIIGNSLDRFQKLLNLFQTRDVFYAGLKIYQRKDSSLFGVYFVGEDIPTVLPLKPSVYNNELKISDYYCMIPGDNTIPYEDFISNTDAAEKYDCGHVVVCLAEEEINQIADNFAVDFVTNMRVESNHYRSMQIIDSGEDHCEKIEQKNLGCDPLAGYNHLAVFMKWAYLKGILAEDLTENSPVLADVLNDSEADIRETLKNDEYIKGSIRLGYFKEDYQDFVRKFYAFNKGDEDHYPRCVDIYAEKYFGTEEYNSDKYKDEAYLFVPFNEEYYKGLSQYIDRGWEKYWQKRRMK